MGNGLIRKIALAGVIAAGVGYVGKQSYNNVTSFNEAQRQINEISKLNPREAIKLDMYCTQKGVTTANIIDSIQKVKAKIKK